MLSEEKFFDSEASLSGFSVLNSIFTRARCKIMYTGRNRNRTDITESALNKLINRKGYANVPVVAHLYKGDDGKWRVGGHDSKFIMNSDGSYEEINETVPFGVIPEDCNPAFEYVTEKTGEVKRYFCVDIILWTNRYNIMDAVKSDTVWFNQSMEINFDSYHYDDDGYCVIEDFNLSALCLLNHDPYNKDNEVEPCFPSASVTKFNLDKLKQEFEVLYDKLKELNARKGECDLDITQIKAKLDGKYILLSANPDSVIAMTKEGFELYDISYKVNTESSEITFAYDKAAKKYFDVSDKDAGVSVNGVKDYFEEVKADIVKGAEKTYSEKCESEKAAAIKELADKFSELTDQYIALKGEYDKAAKTIEKYVAAEEQAKKDKHKANIDAVIAKYDVQLYKNADFLMYKTNVDYTKSPEQIEQDIFVIIGKQASLAGNVNGKAEFSAIWGAQPEPRNAGKGSGGRYGTLFDGFED